MSDLFPRLIPEVGEQIYVRNFLNRISTGVPSLDTMMEGGIPESTVTLISGGAGTGKTALSLYFAYRGLKNGEQVIYTTFEENPKQLINGHFRSS